MTPLFVALALVAAPVVRGKAPAPTPPPTECGEAEWVSFSPKAPYDPAVADVAALVWLPNLLFPCPALFLGVGTAALQGPLPADARAPGIALGHSVAIACCGPPLALSIIGLPLVWLETMVVAPATVLNALDRDVRCARGRALLPAPAPPTPAPTPTPIPPSPLPTDPLPPPAARRDDPLPSPLTPAPPLVPQAMRY